jgi:integrase
MKLTLKSVASLRLPEGKTEHVYFDDDVAGLGLRIREGGARTWIYRYRVSTKQRSITLGSATAVPLPLARETAGKLEAQVRLGGDPAADKQRARAEAGNAVGVLINEYLVARQRDWRPNTATQVRQHLLRHARPLHDLPIGAVTLRDVAKLLGTVAANSGDTARNRLRSSLEAFFGWAIRQGHSLPHGNVVSITEKRPETPRERMLGDAELRAVWQACGDNDYSAVVKLAILTGMRRNEIGGLRWDEVKEDRIELPGSRTKNKRAFTIPLSAPAKAIIEQFRVADRTYVFGITDRAGFKGFASAKESLDARLTGIAPWVLHDLRRSAASGMQRIGIRAEVIERALNHTSGSFRGIAGVYQRDALDRWGRHVLALVEGRAADVVPLKRGA